MLAPGAQGYQNRKDFFDDFKSQGLTDLGTYEDFAQLIGLRGVRRSQQPRTTPKPAALPQGFGDLDVNQANRQQLDTMRGVNTREQPQATGQELPGETFEQKLRRVSKGQSTPQENQRVQKRMQQRMDEIAYEQETGSRMRQPVKDIRFEAPAMARDEYGNVRRDENGNPLVGFTTDQSAVREHQDIMSEQAEWDALSAEDKRERAKQAKLIAEEIEYKEPTLWDTIKKSGRSGIIRLGAEAVDFMEQITSGMIVEDPSSPSGYMKTRSYEESIKDKNDPMTRLSDYLHDTSDRLSREAQPNKGKDFLDMLWDGEIGGVLQKGVGSALESLPMTLSAFHPATMVMNGILMASGNYRDQVLDNPDIPEWKRVSMAIGMATIEQLTEKYADPFFKYVGGSRILRGAAKGASEEIASDLTKKATETLAQRIMKGLGGVAKDAAGEGAEEIITDFGNDALGELLDLASGQKDYGIRAQWEKLKKENPNASLSDFAFQKAKEYIEDGIAGGMAGAYTSGTTQASVKALQFAFGNKVSAEDLAGNPKTRIDPATLEVAQSYDDGYTETEPNLMKQYNDEAQQAQQNLPGYGEEFAKMVMESDSPVETLDYLMQNRDLYTDEQIAAAADYFQKMSRVNGAMDGALDRIDREIENANSEVIYNTHQASGQVITAQVGDGAYYIIGGDVVTDEETGMPVAVGTGGAVVVMDPVTGEKSVKPASQVIVTSMQSADEMIQYNENVLRQQLMQQADDDFTYGRPANEVYQLEDTVTLQDGDGNVVEGEIVEVPNAIDGVYSVQTGNRVEFYTEDQMNRMIVNHNGQEVQRAGGQNGGQNGGQIDNQNVNQNVNQETENAQNAENSLGKDADEVGSASVGASGMENIDVSDGEGGGTDVPPSRTEEPQSALSRIPVNDKGQPDYIQAQPQDSYDALVEELGEEDANAIIESEISDAQKRLQRLEKQQPKGATIEEKKQGLAARRKAVEAEKAQIDYWNSVLEIPKTRKAEAERLANEEAMRKAAEERKAKMQTPLGRQQLLDEAKGSQERAAVAKEIYGDYFNENIGEPDTVEELVSFLLPYGQLNWEGYDRGGRHVRGLQEEIGRGHTRGLAKDRGTSAFNSYLAKKGEGESLDDIVHDMYEDDSNLSGGEHRFTTEEIKDAVIDMLLSAEKPSDIRNYTLNSRIDIAERIMRSELEAEAEDWADFYHLNPEEREAFEDYVMQLGNEISHLSDADIQEINSIFADEYAKIEEYEQQNRGSQKVDRQPDEGTADRENEGGESQVQGQSAGEETAGSDHAGQHVEGAEAGSDQPPVSGDNVPGGAQGVEIAPSEQLKPTDLRDAVRPESAELGVNEANARARALTNEEAVALMQRMEASAAPDPQISLTPETWAQTFGLNNSLETPIGSVKMGEGQYQKFFDKSRSKEFGMAVETLRDPDVVMIEPSQAKEGQTTERPYSYIFVKTFDRNGEKIKYYASVTVQRDNMEVSVSSHVMKPSKVLERLTTLERLYTKETLLSNSSEWRLAEQQDAVPDLLPTQENNVTSEGKVTNNSSNLQENTEKSSEIGATSSPEKIEEEKAKVDTNPTDAQKEAGNYQKGHIKVDGLDISIENPKGSIRRGTDTSGNQWETEMHNTYGYIRGTEATDGDHIDVFLSDDPASGSVYIVDQVDPKTGEFDEVKVMLGFADAAEATKAYLSNYSKGWKGLGAVTGVSREAFKEWIESSHRKTKPFREYALAKREQARQKTRETPETPTKREKSLRDAIVAFLRGIGVKVSDDWKEGQRILDEYNSSGMVKKMGSRVDSKKADLSNELEDKDMDESQQAVADVYTGKKDNAVITVNRDGQDLAVTMRQGNENKAGTKHSLFRHYGTGVGVITADDVLRIPEVLANGERTEKQRGNVRLAQYRLTDESGKRYTVVTEIKNSGEVFNDFYTNKKASNQTPQMPEGDTPESARTNDLNASGAKVQQNPETAKDSEKKMFKTPDGHAYGFTYKGKIYIDPRIATAETPIHEYGHLWVEMKRQTAPEEWNEIKQVMLGDKLVQPIIDRVKRDYPELTKEGREDDFVEEIITQFSGRRGAERLREIAEEVARERGGIFGKAEAVTAMQRLRSILNRFWEGVAKMMGWKYTNANQIADRIMADMLNGVNPVEETRKSGGEGKVRPQKEDVEARDKEYADAVAAGDMEKVDAMLREEARRKGYDESSDYQGTTAFNGTAPAKNDYFDTKEERRNAFEDGEYDGTASLGDYMDSGIDLGNLDWTIHDWRGYHTASSAGKESIMNLRNTVDGKKKTITMYRSVPSDVKENSFRNGDWVTPSREYAKDNALIHGWGRKYRIIEQEVSVDDIWWDNNDINEWGYDDGKGYAYKNAKNNRKLMEPTYDDDGNLIPLSKRFNDRKADVRFQKKGNVRFVDDMKDKEKADVRKRLEGTEALPATEDAITKREGVSARNAAMEWAEKNIPESKDVSTEIGDLIINKKSISDSLAHGFSQAKLDAIPTLLPAFEDGRATYIGSGKDVNGNPITDHYFAYPIDYKGNREYVFCRTREDQNTHRLYIHEVITGEDIKNGQTLQSTAPEKPRTGLPLYRNIMSDVLGGKDTKNINTVQEKTEESASGAQENENNSLKFQRVGSPEPESERPHYQNGEDAMHYAERLSEYERNRRNNEPPADSDDTAMEIYNRAMQVKARKWQEAWQDSMISLKSLQDAIAIETGNKAKGAEDAYSFENRMHGRAKNMGEQYDWQYYQPMLRAFHEFCKHCNMSIEHGMDYLISKSGLERNVYYAFRDAARAKITDDINEERKDLEKEYAKGRMSEDDYKARRQELEEREQNGADEFMNQVRALFPYQHARQQYEDGAIGYTEYLRVIETVIRGQLMRKKPKKDADGNIVSDNYYDDQQKDYSGLTETFAKDMYDEAQGVKKRARRAVDPDERKALWREYDEKMRQAYGVARQVAEDQVFVAEQYESDPAVTHQYTKRLWDAINAATKETLRHSYESGLIDRKNYYKVRDMFDWYIPLRGWEEDKAADVYTYMGKDNVFSPAVKKVWGRQSKAENPLAYIGNIAMSTIIAGHHNQMKQHFLNYVMNNPTSLVSISESWYENIGAEGESPVWVLRTADTAGKSADEIAQIVSDFNDEMAQKQAEGKAIPVRGRLRLDVHATQGQKAEHVIEVQRSGRTYQIYINGDPRAAQALNGTLPKSVTRISDTTIGKGLARLNRSMSAFFTSKNPAFVVSNLSRDLNMAGASVAIKENPEYNARFIKNVAKVLAPRMVESSGWVPASKQPTGLMPSLLRKWKKGTLDPSNETERLFKEFMDEGGETGFVNMLSVDSFKEKMQKEISQMHGSDLLGRGQKECSVRKGLRLMGETFEFYNRCAEDATRFIVYMTSRQMGKTLEESIADAKDVTLNFNRKGTGALGNAEIRDLFIFVNPAIQALANMYRMATGRPLKFAGVTAMFFAGGMLMPIINQWLLNMFGDDDDKEAYWNLPPWVRKNNLVMWMPFTKNFLTIPLAQEFRVFYGAGEMLSTGLSNHKVDKPVYEVLSSVADLVPINPTGNGGNLMIDLAPTGIQPVSQLAFNTDFTGKPIWRENQGNKYAPMYTKAYVTTPNWMIKTSEKINDWTGGNEGKKGLIEQWGGGYVNNPAVWNHLLQGYLGGMYNTIAKTVDVGYTAAKGEVPKVMQMPVVNRFVNRPVERDNAGVLGEDYYRLKDERDALNYELRVFRQKAADGDAEAQKRVDEILSSDEWRQAEVFSHYERIINDMRKGEQAATESADKGDIKKGISDFKQQMMEELEAVGGGRDPLDVAEEQFAKARTFEERNKLRMRMERLMMRRQGADRNKAKPRSEEVEKALRYITDEENESRGTDDNYLMLATPENIRDDARIKAAKAKIREHVKEYRRLTDSNAFEKASEYRQKNLEWFKADDIIRQQSGAMKDNQKLLGKGQDTNIMKNIDSNRNQMLKAIEKLKIDK